MHRQTESAASQRRLKFVFHLHRAASQREQAVKSAQQKNPPIASAGFE